jgi:hypothetical protein
MAPRTTLVMSIEITEIINKGLRPTNLEMVKTATTFPTKAITVTTNGA